MSIGSGALLPGERQPFSPYLVIEQSHADTGTFFGIVPEKGFLPVYVKLLMLARPFCAQYGAQRRNFQRTLRVQIPIADRYHADVDLCALNRVTVFVALKA